MKQNLCSVSRFSLCFQIIHQNGLNIIMCSFFVMYSIATCFDKIQLNISFYNTSFFYYSNIGNKKVDFSQSNTFRTFLRLYILLFSASCVVQNWISDLIDWSMSEVKLVGYGPPKPLLNSPGEFMFLLTPHMSGFDRYD